MLEWDLATALPRDRLINQPLGPRNAYWLRADLSPDAKVVAQVGYAPPDYDLDPASFTDWGVIGAPRFMGRAAMAQALQKFDQEGAWGISPHLIPHR